MSTNAKFPSLRNSRSAALIKRFHRETSGVAAIEFAFLVPLLLCLYFGAIETMQAIDTNRKMNRASAQIADLVSQNLDINKTDIEAIMQIGEASLTPYTRTTPDIRITAAQLSTDASPTAKVLWKRNRLGKGKVFSGSGSSNETVDLPATFKEKGDVVIKVEMSLNYQPILKWGSENASTFGVAGLFKGVPMKKTYYFRPRTGGTVNCSNCAS